MNIVCKVSINNVANTGAKCFGLQKMMESLHSYTATIDTHGTLVKSGPLELVWTEVSIVLDSFCINCSSNSIAVRRVPHYLLYSIHRVDPVTLVLILKSHDIWRIQFQSPSETQRAHDRLTQLKSGISDSSRTFAFTTDLPELLGSEGWTIYDARREFARMGLPSSHWRLSELNSGFQYSQSMPQLLAMPASIQDIVAQNVGLFRGGNCMPYLSYYHRHSCAFIARSGQPLIGTKQRRSLEDEEYLRILFSNRPTTGSGDVALPCVVDARTKSNVATAKIRGGGTEADSTYLAMRTFYTTIENAMSIRDYYQKFMDAVRNLDTSTSSYLCDIAPWMKQVQSCIRPALFIARSVVEQGAPVLVHCDDGVDSTCIVVSLAKILIDPFYRTLRGFMILIEEDWIQSGFRFADRCRSSPVPESSILSLPLGASNVNDNAAPTLIFDSPLFVLFLDCVHQMWMQLPLEFEFNREFLCSLHQHSISCQFGTFLCNTPFEYREVQEHTTSLWSYYNSPHFRHHFQSALYSPAVTVLDNKTPVLPVTTNSRRLVIFSGFYDPWSPTAQLSKWSDSKFRVDINGPLELIGNQPADITVTENFHAVKMRAIQEEIADILGRRVEGSEVARDSVIASALCSLSLEANEERKTRDQNWDPLMNS
eukprot:Partr_v1_DN27232_c2_g1_i1_m38728 putative Myotubularin related protein